MVAVRQLDAWHIKTIQLTESMAKVGYIYRAEVDDTFETNKEWMEQYGCCRIFIEEPKSEKQRVEWQGLLDVLETGDELVVAKFSNAVRSTRELSLLLDLCRVKLVRLISIGDKIDTANKLWPETTAADAMMMLAKLPAEAQAVRRHVEHVSFLKRASISKKVKVLSKSDRELQIVNMYNNGHTIDDIWASSGFKSRSSVFRILNKFNVQLNRGRFSGPLGPRKKKEDSDTEE